MKNINIKKNQFQAFPYHLVDPSPWPILVAFSVFSMAIGAVMYMHGFSNGGLLLNLGFIITVYGMILWFRDVIVEGTNININISNFIKINFNQLIYFIKMLINTFFKNIKFYSTAGFAAINITASQYNNNIKPWFITGLVDGDGSFYISITKNDKLKTKWHVQIYFTIVAGINNPNLIMLQSINKYFNNRGIITNKLILFI